MKCSKCNANLTKEDTFCPECGTEQNQKPQKEDWLKGKGKFLVGIGILIVIALSFVLIYTKSNNQTGCNRPYILVGTSCCLDQDNNKICDDDEKTEVKECVFKFKEMDDFLMSYDYECRDIKDCGEFLSEFAKESGVHMYDIISIDCIPSSYVPLSDIPNLPSDIIDRIKCKTKNDCIQKFALYTYAANGWTPPNFVYGQSYRCNDEGICEVLKNYIEVIKDGMKDRCVMPSGVACLDHRVSTSQIQLVLQNSLGYGMSSITVTISGCGNSNIPTRLANGAKAVYNITCSSALTFGAEFSGDITFNYTNDETELSRSLKGDLTSKVE